ncbi:hypothetical protein [Mycobacterium lepromatosis]|uniref:hypothetical protein n=1 Tax=Mycobacterium lepromatosis TaxID=480418 RepID=UPI002351EFC8|nr:hypothetical protein [Mycobacterium lepromatosis]
MVTDLCLELTIQRMLIPYRTSVAVVTEPYSVDGWQQVRKYLVAQLMAANPGSWNPNQYNYPDNVNAYQLLTLELASPLGCVDVLVCSVGTGGVAQVCVSSTGDEVDRREHYRVDNLRAASVERADVWAGLELLSQPR